MDVVDQLRAFVATAQTGSFTAAAEYLRISNRLTSKYVAELEQRLGVQLFQRTTRKVGLTPAGEDLMTRAPALLDDLDHLLADVSQGSRGLTGLIRISAPVTFGELYLADMLGRFSTLHPGLTVDLRLEDRYIDLATDGIDIVFRIGETDRLSLKLRKLGELQSFLVASPDYLAQHGTPQTPEELVQHTCIIDTNRRNPSRWELRSEDRQVSVKIEGRFYVNSARAACALAVSGMGIAFSPRFSVKDELAAGRLVRLPMPFAGVKVPISAAYLESQMMSHKTRAVIDFAVADIVTADIL
ncbi:LysR family transcriptional regulator [Pseudodonghicola flavimaris]|uniref:LysR family transcriptional regulator n=1 Tax=Pseudodonghicola flavimaris TaxID=3050036 RepID=A0ABT7F1U3_9RHOB|nr:LysR family transcriptional regulator [Pseudodonghicola flavimaris]MDK3018574.1 LysR family transcriptional regulator [Pseudodonghicola flavimaris]